MMPRHRSAATTVPARRIAAVSAAVVILVVLIFGGPMSQPLNPQPTAMIDARLRVGTVQATPPPQADYVWVLVDGTVIPAAYFTGYVPVPGDRVAVTQSGTDWFVVGGRSGFASNLVVNPTFLGHYSPFVGPNFPFTWSAFVASGSNTQFTVNNAVAGYPVGELSAIGAGDIRAVSAAFPVRAGQNLACSWTGTLAAGVNTQMDLRLGWFSNGQSAYPAVVTSDTVVDTTTLSPPASFNRTGSPVAVPAAATYARLVIRATNSVTFDILITFANAFSE